MVLATEGVIFINCINSVWAKKKEEKGRLLWLPLIQHLEDTRLVAGFLWERWLSSGQRRVVEASLGEASDGLAKRLVEFIAYTHDIGKLTSSFSLKTNYLSPELDRAVLERMEKAGFAGISALKLGYADKTPHTIAGQYLLHKFGVKDDIAAIVGGHHGRPVDAVADIVDDGYLNQECYAENYNQDINENSDVHRRWKDMREEFFAEALKKCGFSHVGGLPAVNGIPAQAILLGLLTMADWIASNEEYFPLIDIDEDEVVDKEARARGYDAWEKNAAWQAKAVKDVDSTYRNRFGFLPASVQRALAEVIESTEDPGIYIVEAPMGSGKTEAALISAEQLAYKSGCNGLFFGLPTQATSNGIFPRILSWLQAVGKDSEKDGLKERHSLRLSHGKAHLNETFRKLGDATSTQGSDGQGVDINRWFSGRNTAALDEFVVGTVDQFLMTALKQKHLALRHLGFSKKVVVIDEVHACDAYMNQYLLRSIMWLGAYGVPVILLSATLPSEVRKQLAEAYVMGTNKKPENDGATNRIEETLRYPLITYSDGATIKQYDDFSSKEEKRVRIVRKKDEALITLVAELLEDGGVLGIVCNTVKRAQAFGRSLSEVFGEEVVEVLHSGFIATDRKRKEDRLLKEIGKNGMRPAKRIVVGTQVIEQSLDIDFDVMISDLAPMDLLMQRIGRLHRHDRERPSVLKKPQLYLLGTSAALDFEEGAAAVYGEHLLCRTQQLLPEEVQIPVDISPLVQAVYGEGSVNLDNAFAEKCSRFKEAYEKRIKEKRKKAKVYQIEKPLMKRKSLIGWLKNVIPDDSEARAYAQVRDGEDTIEVIALKRVPGGYCFFGGEEELSCRIDEDNVARKIAEHTLTLPRVFTKAYTIDETIDILEAYNTKYLGSWRDSVWLNGALGIIFDENNEFSLGGYTVLYDEKFGIRTERK